MSSSCRKSGQCATVAAAGLLLLLACVQPAHAQVPFFDMNWLQPALSNWFSQFWADNQEEDGTRLASLPDMFGDSFGRGGVLTVANTLPLTTTASDVLLAGGTRGLRISEHNKAIPMNRIYVAYNYFNNAADFSISAPPLKNQLSINRYTFGAESRFAGGLWSLELQMPFAGDQDIGFPGGLAGSNSGQIGNLSAILKRLIYYDGQSSVVAGLGVETPTGSDFTSRTADVNYLVSNDAVHLHPYLGLLSSPGDRWFFNGFLQVDVATNGNRVLFDDAFSAGNVAGRFNDQTLLYVDVGGGYWLWRDMYASLISGLATMLEFHYTTTLNNTDSLIATPLSADESRQTMLLTNPANRVDVVNVTAAVHAALGPYTSFRVGGVFPMRIADNRFFDAEVAAQLIRRF